MPRNAAHTSRRDVLRVGVVGVAGLTLPQLLRSQAMASGGLASADACIFVFLWGAPSQFETFDPKPHAPDGIRGEFGVRATRLPGIQFGEHVPQLAERNDRFSLIRTCAQTSTHHQSAAYEALTGYPPTRDAVALTATPTDHPNLGSIVAKYGPGGDGMPRFVQLPQLASDVGNLTPGQFAGFLGRKFDPFAVVSDPNEPAFRINELGLPADVAATRLDDRRALLHWVDRQQRTLDQSVSAHAIGAYQERAVQLLTRPATRRAFDLGLEPAGVRERYGRNTLGQSCLLARRLVESGVKLVTVCSGFNGKTPQDAWDTHKDNFRRLKNELLPPFDRGVSALMDDLTERGLSKRTLLVVMGEFGRTPRINKDAGRDHWEHCYVALFAGGGMRSGLVLGQSDRHGAYPVQGPICSPGDLCATIYQCLGIDPRQTMTDPQGKPMPLAHGMAIPELF